MQGWRVGVCCQVIFVVVVVVVAVAAAVVIVGWDEVRRLFCAWDVVGGFWCLAW